MGRLTYSARKISGVKAGQVVSKDLKKRIPPNSGAKAAARDPTLALDITGKCLTDEGFAEFIDDLIDCIKFRGGEHPFGLIRLTELHLQGNNLTVRSLAKLAEVIASNPGNIRELDLSQNEINIVDYEEKAIWKEFLCAFKNCYVLKKLDLSGNVLGIAGVETLAQLYLKSDVEFTEADAVAIVKENHGLEVDDDDEEEENALAEEFEALKIDKGKEKENVALIGRAKKSPAKGMKAGKQNGTSSVAATPSKNTTAKELKKYACTRGLRSIPYLILSNIELGYTSVVHLSHMVATQRASEQLLESLPPGKSSTIPETAHATKSLIWQPHGKLPTKAKRLLEVSESLRDVKNEAQIEDDSDDEATEEEDEDTKRKRESKLKLEHTRLLKRVRIESLSEDGVHANHIAFTALQMGLWARSLLLEDKDRASKTSEPTEDGAVVSEEPLPEEPAPEEHDEVQVQYDDWEVPMVDQPPTPKQLSTDPQYSTPPAIPGPFHPSAELFDAEFPALGPIRETPTKPATTKPEPSSLPELNQALNSEAGQLPEEDSDTNANEHDTNGTTTSPAPARHSGGKGTPRVGAIHKDKKEEWRFGLTYENWRCIIADVVGADGVLDREQQERIIHYASDWDSLAYEMKIQGAEDAQQVWKYLDTVECFTYSALP